MNKERFVKGSIWKPWWITIQDGANIFSDG